MASPSPARFTSLSLHPRSAGWEGREGRCLEAPSVHPRGDGAGGETLVWAIGFGGLSGVGDEELREKARGVVGVQRGDRFGW